MTRDPVGDRYEDAWRRDRGRYDPGDADGLIPFRNGMALAAYYCGVLSLPLCFVGLGIVGIVPVILGILGLMKANEDSRARGRVHAWVGVILGIVEILSSCAIFAYLMVVITQASKK